MSNQWHGGKGDKPRSVNNEKYASNWDSIFRTNEIIEGKEPTVISEKLLKDNKDLINNPDDCNNFWFVLALALWETKSLDKELYHKVKSIIESGQWGAFGLVLELKIDPKAT